MGIFLLILTVVLRGLELTWCQSGSSSSELKKARKKSRLLGKDTVEDQVDILRKEVFLVRYKEMFPRPAISIKNI